jgi:hypothetical protein
MTPSTSGHCNLMLVGNGLDGWSALHLSVVGQTEISTLRWPERNYYSHRLVVHNPSTELLQSIADACLKEIERRKPASGGGRGSMSTREFAERNPDPPVRAHCCTCEHCITEDEAEPVLAPLNWLSEPYPQPQRNAVLAAFMPLRRRPPASVWKPSMLVQIGAAMDRIEQSGQAELAAVLNKAWLDLEAADAVFREAFTKATVCTEPGSCVEHGSTRG